MTFSIILTRFEFPFLDFYFMDLGYPSLIPIIILSTLKILIYSNQQNY